MVAQPGVGEKFSQVVVEQMIAGERREASGAAALQPVFLGKEARVIRIESQPLFESLECIAGIGAYDGRCARDGAVGRWVEIRVE